MGVESNWVEFAIGATNGEDASDGIVRHISFHNQWNIRDPMS